MNVRLAATLCLLFPLTASALFGEAQSPSPIVYDLRFPDLTQPRIEVEMFVPTEGRETLDLFMAVWSPGYYRQEDHATRIESFSAHDPQGPEGRLLPLAVVAPNRWRVETRGASAVLVRYVLRCDEEPIVTRNWVGEAWGVVNGPATFLAVEGELQQPHSVRIHAPAAWPQVQTALPALRGNGYFHFGAVDFDTLLDAPILAGKLKVWEFEVEGIPHALVSGGDLEGWDGERAVADLDAHAYNGKRLRPVQLGPFDYLDPPTTESLWIAEGLTVHITGQILCRAGLHTWEPFLEMLSFRIGRLQASPGRRFQTLRDASIEVWNEGRSGLFKDLDRTVSYYLKGQVVGILLDVEIQRATGGERSLRDLMRLAYARYSGERGFTPEEFQRTASEVAGIDLGPWFERALYSTEELDYQPLLDWYGLRLVQLEAPPEAGAEEARGRRMPNTVKLEVREDATPAQRERLEGCGEG